jgi:hypothetical protein
MFTTDAFRAITDEREREIQDLVRVRNLLRGGRHEREVAQAPRRGPKPRSR